MSIDHPPSPDFALFVMGALDPPDSERLEPHVRSCAPCAELLADEARFESKLWALTSRAPSASAVSTPLPSVPPPRAAAIGRRQLVASALMLLAASLVFVAGSGRMSTAPPPVCRAPETSRHALIESAEFRTCSAPSPAESTDEALFTPLVVGCDKPQ